MSSQQNMVYETDQNKTLKNNSIGPKYLIIQRINSENSLKNVSPYLKKKIIDCVCGEVATCKTLANGNMLIKTKTCQQATKLIKLTAFSPLIKVEVTEHNALNYSKGVIYFTPLIDESEETILNEAKSQNVVEVKKIMRREGENLKATGLTIFTFGTPEMPEYITIGYEKISLRPYIPTPLMCKNCQHYGHLAKFCKNTSICANCGSETHTNDQNPCCDKQPNCVNCVKDNRDDTNHCATNKKCPIFLKHKEIQAIKVHEKCDMKTANRIYYQRHPNTTSFAQATRNPTVYSSIDSLYSPQQNELQKRAEKENKKRIVFSSLENLATTSNLNTPQTQNSNTSKTENPNNKNSSTSKNETVKIIPRNATKRQLYELKTKDKKKKPIPSDKNIDSTNKDTEFMDE